MPKKQEEAKEEKQNYIVTDRARSMPRRMVSPLNPLVFVGVGGDILMPASGQNGSYKIREASHDEYLAFSKIALANGMKGVPGLVENVDYGNAE